MPEDALLQVDLVHIQQLAELPTFSYSDSSGVLESASWISEMVLFSTSKETRLVSAPDRVFPDTSDSAASSS